MAKTVRDAMTPKPRCISRSTSVVIAARMMEDENVGSLPVVDNDDFLVGIVTDRDVALRVVAAGRDPASTQVGDIFTENPISAYPDEPLDAALEHMASRQSPRRSPNLIHRRGPTSTDRERRPCTHATAQCSPVRPLRRGVAVLVVPVEPKDDTTHPKLRSPNGFSSPDGNVVVRSLRRAA